MHWDAHTHTRKGCLSTQEETGMKKPSNWPKVFLCGPWCRAYLLTRLELLEGRAGFPFPLWECLPLAPSSAEASAHPGLPHWDNRPTGLSP